MVFILPEPFVKLLGQRSALTILSRGASHDGEEDTHSYDQQKQGSVRGERSHPASIEPNKQRGQAHFAQSPTKDFRVGAVMGGLLLSLPVADSE
jgi:hypothetical protein